VQRQIAGLFVAEECGAHELKGVPAGSPLQEPAGAGVVAGRLRRNSSASLEARDKGRRRHDRSSLERRPVRDPYRGSAGQPL
jgi:hypothetical protein